MAKKDNGSSAKKLPHTVKYNDGSQDIEATFPTKAHADVLINRLKAHGVSHSYDGPAEPVAETVPENTDE